MDRSNVIKLIGFTYEEDDIGQEVKTETARDVYCDIGSVTGAEWFEASKQGMNAQFRITMFRYDYNNEQIVEFNGKRYGVYRSYIGKNDTIELYLERKAGV